MASVRLQRNQQGLHRTFTPLRMTHECMTCNATASLYSSFGWCSPHLQPNIPRIRTSPGPFRRSRSPSHARALMTDSFDSASEGMHSMWDRLSSGAGAAFSAVRDARQRRATHPRAELQRRPLSQRGLTGLGVRPHRRSRDSTNRT